MGWSKVIDFSRGDIATTDATATALYTFTVPNSSSCYYEFEAVGYRTGGGAAGSVGDSCCFKTTGGMKRVGSATVVATLAASIDKTFKDDVAVGNPSVTISTGTVSFKVTGAASMNISWAVRIRIVTVSQ